MVYYIDRFKKMMIKVYEPVLGKEELNNVIKCIKSGVISGSAGEFILEFEEKFAKYCGCKYGITTSSGTTALHLALASLGIKKGDEVITTTLTNAATVFSIIYCNAKPVLVDIEPDTWNVDVNKIEEKITDRTVAILPVHLYGHPVDMDTIFNIAKEHKLKIIEDDAEAHGAEYKGRKVGGLGDIGCFSFYANKIITTGEGGMLTTNNEQISEQAKLLRNLAFSKERRFLHNYIGFNYRMSVDYDEPLIYMNDGNIKLESIGKIYDKVIKTPSILNNLKVVTFDKNFKLSFKKIGGFIKHKLNEKKLYEIILGTGRRVRVTGSHSVYAIENGELKPKLVSFVKLGNFLAIPKKLPTQHMTKIIDLKKEFINLGIPITEKKGKIAYTRRYPDGSLRPTSLYINRYIKYSPELFRLMGYYVSEGCINKWKQKKYRVINGVSGEIAITFGSHEIEYIEDITRIINKLFGKIHIQKIKHSTNSIQLKFGGVLLATFFKKIIKAGNDTYSKRIPELVFNAPIPLKIEFLKGYFGDGYYCKKNGRQELGFTTASKELASDLLYLLLQIGIPANVQRNKAKKAYVLNKLCSIHESHIIKINIAEYINKLSSVLPRTSSPLLKHTHQQGIRNFPINHIGLRQLFNDTKQFRHIRNKKTGRYISPNGITNDIFIPKGINSFQTASPEKITAILDYIKKSIKYAKNKKKYLSQINKIKKFINSDLAFAKVINIRHVPPTTNFVYDISVPSMENFVGGFGGIILHNSNLHAAIGVAQLKKIDKIIERKREIAASFNKKLYSCEGITLPIEKSWAKNVYWMYCILIEKEFGINRDELMERLSKEGNIETRTFFIPMHQQPAFHKMGLFNEEKYPIAEEISKKGMYLPSGLNLTEKQIEFICDTIKNL